MTSSVVPVPFLHKWVPISLGNWQILQKHTENNQNLFTYLDAAVTKALLKD